jgi:lipopolysaccharide transport system permease protein
VGLVDVSVTPGPCAVFEAADGRLITPRDHLRRALRYRVFLGYWLRRNLLTRYRQTTLGPLWAVLQPMLSGLVYAFVFAVVLRVQIHGVPYTVFVVTNLVLWTYSMRTILIGPAVLLAHLDLITRVQFPREFLPVGVWLESLVDLMLGLAVTGVFFAYYRVPVTPYALGALVVFLVHTVWTLGVTFLVAAIAIKVRDLLQVMPVLLQLALYLAPVVYPLDLVPAQLRTLYLLNPLGTIFAAYQETLLFGRFTLSSELAVAAAVSLALLAGGYGLFKSAEWELADLL